METKKGQMQYPEVSYSSPCYHPRPEGTSGESNYWKLEGVAQKEGCLKLAFGQRAEPTCGEPSGKEVEELLDLPYLPSPISSPHLPLTELKVKPEGKGGIHTDQPMGASLMTREEQISKCRRKTSRDPNLSWKAFYTSSIKPINPFEHSLDLLFCLPNLTQHFSYLIPLITVSAQDFLSAYLGIVIVS